MFTNGEIIPKTKNWKLTNLGTKTTVLALVTFLSVFIKIAALNEIKR